MKRKRFADFDKVKKKTTEALSNIVGYEFKQCVEKRNKIFDKCIISSEKYFEGN